MDSRSSQKRVRRVKTFSGCWRCRSRKVKCDESSPECINCQKLGKPCSGYGDSLVWITPKSGYIEKKRRTLRADLTWSGYQLYCSDELDHLIDAVNEVDQQAKIVVRRQTVQHGPFGVFLISPTSIWSPSVVFHESSEAAFLFDHYVKHVAPQMMPIEHPQNPWKHEYPQMSLNSPSSIRLSLYHGMLSQAAANVAHRRKFQGVESKGMLLVATSHYVRAVKMLRQALRANAAIEYAIFLACVLTLIMAELYSGKSQGWKCHLDCAWKFFIQRRHQKPWLDSKFAWVTTQSLLLLKIRSDTNPPLASSTSCQAQVDETMNPLSLLRSVATCGDLGFTVGAAPETIAAIAHTNVGLDHAIDMLPPGHKIQESGDGGQSTLAQKHADIFHAATHIYRARLIADPPPSTLQPLVSNVLRSCLDFYRAGGGFATLWPFVVAAAEAYTAEDIAQARAWFWHALGAGVGNWSFVQSSLEKIWERRNEEASKGTNPGSFKLRWWEEEGFRDLVLI